jgi:hypothetical protein
MHDGERRVREQLASRRAPGRGLLDALCEGALQRLPDGDALFFPWGALGRGYRVPAGSRAARLRRSLRAVLAAGLLAPAAAVLVAAQAGRLAPACWLLAATTALSLLCLALLPRGLARSDARLRRGEAGARIAEALDERTLRRTGGICLALALAALAASTVWRGAPVLSAASGAFLVASLGALAMRLWKRRAAPHPAPDRDRERS